ncbi:DUF1120 domain-containing protein [Enterobacteriaceae bacterium RIT693]|jgi:hypothetical protein|nr:DUF1120 domain-containing protein [Enterobacteriaceae bacterium RIT693]
MRYSKLFLMTSLLVAGSAHAANPTINVSGKITPPACSASIVGGGENLVWDPISHNNLSNTTFTPLTAKAATLSVTCEDGLKTHIAFWATDANAASAIPGVKVPDTTLDNGNAADRIFGIGLDPVTNNKIGNFTLVGKTSSYDGTENSAKFGYGGRGVESFAITNFGWGYRFAEDWTVLDTTTNQAAVANTFTFTFDVVPQINRKSQITNAQEVAFAGSAQFYVRYF